jgi:AraC family transcriptional activator of pobA
VASARDISVDHLSEALEVLLLAEARCGAHCARGPRRPHRHDYHELIWTRSGEGHHLIDGEPSPVEAGTVTVIGRGRVHVFERGRSLHGAVVRFGGELLYGDAAARANPAWLLAGRGARTVAVPAGEVPRLDSAIETLAAEARRPADACSLDLQRHFLSAVLLWVERWYEASRTQQREADDADVQLHRRFVDLLSVTSPATPTPATTPTRCACPRPCSRARCRR